ncbi:MAG: hypothetical protein ABI831_05120 [Betaproteobacteria bacterium]
MGRLNAGGVATTMLIGEDYGLLVGIVSDPHRLYVACSNADASATQWQVFVIVEDGASSSPAKTDESMSALKELHRTVKDILSKEPAIAFLRERI